MTDHVTAPHFLKDFTWAVCAADIYVIPLWGIGALNCMPLSTLAMNFHECQKEEFRTSFITAKLYAMELTSVLEVRRDKKWYIFLRLDLFAPRTASYLSIGRNAITLEYYNRYAALPNQLTVKQHIFLQQEHADYPDEWSGMLLVWDQYLPLLQISPIDWHLDIFYTF